MIATPEMVTDFRAMPGVEKSVNSPMEKDATEARYFEDQVSQDFISLGRGSVPAYISFGSRPDIKHNVTTQSPMLSQIDSAGGKDSLRRFESAFYDQRH